MKTDSEPPERPTGEARETEARVTTSDTGPDPQQCHISAEQTIMVARRMLREANRMQINAARMSAVATQMRERLRLEQLTRSQCFIPHYSNPALSLMDPYLLAASDLPRILETAIDAALLLVGADMGNIQLINPANDALQIEAQRGFERPFLDFFASVHQGQAACGLALARAERVVVEDVTKSPVFAGSPALDVMIDAGARAVLSLPIIGSSGRTLGVFSTHYRQLRRPTESDLRLLDLLARVAARWIERKSGALSRQDCCW